MSTPTLPPIDFIQDGEPGVASTFNRPIRQLASLLGQFLAMDSNARLDGNLVAYGAPLGSGCTVGTPVYYDTESVSFLPCVRRVLSEQNGRMQLDEASLVVGVVSATDGPSLGNITRAGRVTLTLAQLLAVSVTGQEIVGEVWLAGGASEHGKITNIRPSVGVTVGAIAGPVVQDGQTVYFFDVVPQWDRDTTHHQHSRFRINPTVGPGIDEWTSVIPPDAPAGAVLMYNMDPVGPMASVWPPIPVSGCAYILGGVVLDMDNPTPLVRVTNTGVFWMASTISPDASQFSFHELWMHTVAGQDDGTVNSLTAEDGSITLTGEDGQVIPTGVAGSGNLRVRASYSLATSNSTGVGVETGQAVVAVDGQTLQFGRVVHTVKSLHPALTVNGLSLSGTPDDKYGHLTLAFNPTQLVGDQEVRLSDLNGSQVLTQYGIRHLALENNDSAEIRIHVPSSAVAGSSVVLNFDALITLNGVLPALDVQYLRVPQPPASPTTVAVGASPSAATALDISGASSMLAGTMTRKTISLTSAASGNPLVTVDPGDTLTITVSRSAADAYAGKVCLAKITWSLTNP